MTEPTAQENRRSKRERLAEALRRTGMLRLGVLVTSCCVPGALIVLNYHRVLNLLPGFPGDPALVDATPRAFRQQMEILVKETAVVDLDGARRFLAGERLPRRRPPALVTFDDGYLDNFTHAFPVLRELGLPAVFFGPTADIGTSHRFWWGRSDEGRVG